MQKKKVFALAVAGVYLVSGLTSQDLRPLLKKVLTPLKLILGSR